ncbi:flagellar biosynthetic protein FliO [Allosphingosinicella deserti]|uniref:Uncharacterized protein n=1 Tax=Allosphingosinicella deserti TaxID=2116704 RepID=A0A2P7QW81_9SPHN|nr:flagellar biosynthetic protein FliO [Sphingomonas deserti]PSJ42199.1 hypothetical protein C7I55_08165 [Sphingomonas deserti]
MTCHARPLGVHKAGPTAGLAALLLCAGPALANGLGRGEALDISLGRIVAGFLVSVGVAAAAIFVLRQRRGGGGPIRLPSWRLALRQPEIQVVETRRLSQHGDICLVRNQGREYLLLVTAGQSRILRETELPPAGTEQPA